MTSASQGNDYRVSGESLDLWRMSVLCMTYPRNTIPREMSPGFLLNLVWWFAPGLSGSVEISPMTAMLPALDFSCDPWTLIVESQLQNASLQQNFTKNPENSQRILLKCLVFISWLQRCSHIQYIFPYLFNFQPNSYINHSTFSQIDLPTLIRYSIINNLYGHIALISTHFIIIDLIVIEIMSLFVKWSTITHLLAILFIIFF